MAIKLADTLVPMADFPAVMAEHTEFADGESLQKKLDSGTLGGGGASYKQLSQAEYDALTDDEKMNGKEYRTYDTGHIYKLGVEYGKDVDISKSEVLTTYVSISDLNARKGTSVSLVANEDNTQKIIDALDAKEQFVEWFGNSTSNNRFGINTKYGTRINELRIVKMTATDATVIAIMDSGITLSRVYTSSALGAWCVKKEKSTALVTNAQNFKIDLTKNNASWYGMFTFNFTYGYMPCEINFVITDKVYYTITKGQNVVSAITYTQNGANYIIGIDFTTKMYGTQVIDMPSEFGTINSLTAETFAGTTSAIYNGAYSMKSYSSLADLGLTTSATINDIISKMVDNSMFVYKTDVFDISKYENLQYATVSIIRQSNSRIQAIMTDKDTGNLYVGKMDSTNKIVGWTKVATEEIIHTDLSGNLAGITTVLDLVNALLTEYRATSPKKPIRFVSGEITKTTLTDLPVTYGLLQITVSGYDVVEVRLAHSSFGFKSMYYGFINRISGEASISSITWEKVATTDYVDSKIGGDVAKTSISISALDGYSKGNVYYQVKNGICYMSFEKLYFTSGGDKTITIPYAPTMRVVEHLLNDTNSNICGMVSVDGGSKTLKISIYGSSYTTTSSFISFPVAE